MPADKFTKAANTPAKKRQWDHVYNAQLDAGKSKKVAIMSANAVVRDTPTKSKSESGSKSSSKKR